MPREEYIGIGEAAKRYGVTTQTLRKWIADGKVPCRRIGETGRRLVPVNLDRKPDEVGRGKFFYCRVSSNHQKDDLERQAEKAKELYPQHTIIKDVGSGLNWKRRGIVSLLERIIRGEVEEVVVFHRDRLCRFGFDLVSLICREKNTRITIHNQENFNSPKDELAQDILSIITVFACKEMGRRRYRKATKSDKDEKESEDQDISDSDAETATVDLDGRCESDL